MANSRQRHVALYDIIIETGPPHLVENMAKDLFKRDLNCCNAAKAKAKRRCSNIVPRWGMNLLVSPIVKSLFEKNRAAFVYLLFQSKFKCPIYDHNFSCIFFFHLVISSGDIKSHTCQATRKSGTG